MIRRYIIINYTNYGCYFVVTDETRRLLNVSIGFPNQESCLQAIRRAYSINKEYSYTVEYQEDGKLATERLQ